MEIEKSENISINKNRKDETSKHREIKDVQIKNEKTTKSETG